jgi:hypothetical protein
MDGNTEEPDVNAAKLSNLNFEIPYIAGNIKI